MAAQLNLLSHSARNRPNAASTPLPEGRDEDRVEYFILRITPCAADCSGTQIIGLLAISIHIHTPVYSTLLEFCPRRVIH